MESNNPQSTPTFNVGSETKTQTRQHRPRNAQKKVNSPHQEIESEEYEVSKKTRVEQNTKPRTTEKQWKPRSNSFNKQEPQVGFFIPERAPKITSNQPYHKSESWRAPAKDINPPEAHSYPPSPNVVNRPPKKYTSPKVPKGDQTPTHRGERTHKRGDNTPTTTPLKGEEQPSTEKKKKRHPKRKSKSNTEPSTPKQTPKQTPSSKRKEKDRFDPYLEDDKIQEGLKAGTLYKGVLRINAHNSREAYATVEGLTKDVYIEGFTQRNRAFEGDVVVVELYDKSKWKILKSVLEEEEDEEKEPKVVSELMEELFEDETPPTPEANLPVEIIRDASSELEEQPMKVGSPQPHEEEEDEEDEDEEVVQVEDPFELEEQPKEEKDDEEDNVEPEVRPVEQMASSRLTKLDPQIPMTPLIREMNKLKVTTPAKTPKVKEQKGELQPTGKVVAVLEAKHSTEQVGYVKPVHGADVKPDDRFACFIPMDVRVPKVIVPIGQVPDFYKNAKLYETKLVRVDIIGWKSSSYLPMGKYRGVLGEAGEIAPETEAILIQNKVDFREFSPEVLKCVQLGSWKIPPEEFKRRRDLRNLRIFTIDPATAKDLDDALHCISLPDGNFEVGVHIADVSFFVTPGTALDVEAQKRCTTVYLIQKAIPMLPHILCENLCSLNPGVDRLAFSVIWKLTPEGKILEEWFGRTIIRSCSKMAYDVAQFIIEGKITKSFEEMEANKNFPHLGPMGNHTVEQIVQDITNLQSIAKILRKKRFENGALSINNVKLAFKLNEAGNPVSSFQYITKEANHMIEEFMLLANQQVAIKISSSFPDTALLRNHVTPLLRKLETFVKFCSKHLGIDVDHTTAKSLATSMDILRNSVAAPKFAAIQLLATRSMQLAKYFCTGDLPEEEWKHYALNVNHYTHFTSPIRRYADIIVHRLLQAAISQDTTKSIEDLTSEFSLLPSKDDLSKVAAHCNEKKLSARKAQEASGQLFLCVLLKDRPVIDEAVVLGVGEKFLTVILSSFAIEKRIYLEDLHLNKVEANGASVILHWPTSLTGEKTDVSIPQEVNILDLVHVRVATKLSKARPDLDVYLLHPSEVEEYKGKKPEPSPLDSKESHSSVVEEDYQGVD